jgi:predicted nucleic acid-binding protein
VIAYFDTSAVLPLVVDEPSSGLCNRVWSEATRVVSVRLLYPEARAALAKAERMGRLSRAQLTAAVAELDTLVDEVDVIEVTAELAHAAGELAQAHGLRGYDAVHLAAARSIADDDLVIVTGDDELAVAAQALGITVAMTTAA